MARRIVLCVLAGIALLYIKSVQANNEWVQPVLVEELSNVRVLDDALIQVGASADSLADIEQEAFNEAEAEFQQEIDQEADAEAEAEGENAAEADAEADAENESFNENELVSQAMSSVDSELDSAVAAESNAEAESSNESGIDRAKLEKEIMGELENEVEGELTAAFDKEKEQLALLEAPVGILPDGHHDHHGDALYDASKRALKDSTDAKQLWDEAEGKIGVIKNSIRSHIAAHGHPADENEAQLGELEKLVERLRDLKGQRDNMKHVYDLATHRTQRLIEAYNRHVQRAGVAVAPETNVANINGALKTLEFIGDVAKQVKTA